MATTGQGRSAGGPPELSLKGRALRLLSTREHTRAELERRLAPHADSPEALAEVLDGLQQRGFISEARVVESLLYRRAPQMGSARIRRELQSKGVEPEAVAEAVETLRGSEFERARALWLRKFQAPAADAAGHARQMRFLLTRGFAADIARKVVAGQEAGG